jgi:beta-galactosidase
MSSRRRFLGLTPALAAGALANRRTLAASPDVQQATAALSIDGEWHFATDPNDEGEQQFWFHVAKRRDAWRDVCVPHTWQIEEALADYRGVAWYARTFESKPEWQGSCMRIGFEAVFHSARVWVNGEPAGEHLRKPYTAFAVDVTKLVRLDRPNTVVVRVDNRFDEHMLPRGRSSDWAHDGGIYRPVQLLVTPKIYIDRLAVDAVPDFTTGKAAIRVDAVLQNTDLAERRDTLSLRILEEETGHVVHTRTLADAIPLYAQSWQRAGLSASLDSPELWHFDHPHLYRAEVTLKVTGVSEHTLESTFGIRKFETRGLNFYLNNERVTLMGVERMAGSNPEFGMAEPLAWIEHDHADLRNLNCIFTRVHWPQDRRLLDYWDRHGILIQTEVPTWGPDTFKNMGAQCDPDLMENGLEQLREMIARDRNHPSVVCWGLCNEIGGQNPPAYDFAKNMLAEAKKLDPNRLCSYASNSLLETPRKDVAALMDFVEFNEYFETWYQGNLETLSKSLDRLATEIPNKPIVISEYGYCACTAERPEGDQRRIEILRTHNAVFRKKPYIGGLIFFCYNDYRTHIGDRGVGVMKQRVHGVVDVYGNRKGSYDVLRIESSPVESLKVEGHPKEFFVTITSRKTIPAYRLSGYTLRGLYFEYGEIPIERKEVAIPVLEPGQTVALKLSFSAANPLHIQFDVLRPGGDSTYTLEWKA